MSICNDLYDSPEFVGQDPCSSLASDYAMLYSNPALFDGRNLQAMLLDAPYPFGQGNEQTYETLINQAIAAMFLLEGEDKRSDPDRFAQLAFGDIPAKLTAVFKARQECNKKETETTAGESAGTLIGGVIGGLIGFAVAGPVGAAAAAAAGAGLGAAGGQAVGGFVSAGVNGACAGALTQVERELTLLETMRGIIEAHDALIDNAEIFAIDTNVRRLSTAIATEAQTTRNAIAVLETRVIELITDVANLDDAVIAVDVKVDTVTAAIAAISNRRSLAATTERDSMEERLDRLEANVQLIVSALTEDGGGKLRRCKD